MNLVDYDSESESTGQTQDDQKVSPGQAAKKCLTRDYLVSLNLMSHSDRGFSLDYPMPTRLVYCVLPQTLDFK